MTLRNAARPGLAATGALVLLGGCGTSFADESAAEIERASVADMKEISSLHMQGELTSGGEEVTLDLSLTDDGDCTGTVGVRGGTAEIASIAGQSWFRADEAFWEASAGQAAPQITAIVGDKWVVQPEDTGSFSTFCDLDSLLEELGTEDDAESEKQEGTEQVEGRGAVVLVTETEDGDPLTVWVAVEEPHHILKLEVTEGEQPGTVTFSRFDEAVEVEAPAQQDTIDLSDLRG